MTIESIVNLTVGKLAELLVQEAKLLYGVEEEVTNIQNELDMMNSFLVDMEALDDEVGDERIRNTAKEIRKIAYDAEDVIESFILKGTPAETEIESAKKDFLHKYLCFCKCLAKTHTVGTEIEAITKRISRTTERLKRYRGENGLTKAVGESPNKPKVWKPIAYSYTKEDHVVGLAEDINKLVSDLTTNVDVEIRVLSIVGMGWSGKTTLARAVYNHENVKQCFESMAWVSISQQWVPQHVLHDILRKVSGDTVKLDEERTPMYVKDKIQEYLTPRKYLIVLDDVRKKDALGEILQVLPPGTKGSKIVVTTRFHEVVDYPGLKRSIHEPRGLTAEDSWKLFSKILGPEREKNTTPEMKELAKDMLTKCKGLPLAVVALAGLLANKETLEEWERVKKAMSSMVMEVGRGTHSYGALKHMLTLSYNDLPRDIKPCFLYLGVYPEDSQIPTSTLINLWIAEGFVLSSNIHHQGQTLEDLAMDYLNEMIGRCVVRVVTRNYEGKPKSIEIHDLLRDLCIQKAKELNFLEILSPGFLNPGPIMDTQSRRTIIHSYRNNDSLFSEGNWPLRSLFVTNDDRRNYTAELRLEHITSRFKLLRVLNIDGIDSPDGTLPSEIGSLIHLRYLGIISTNIYKLPSTMENLRNLLTLKYSYPRGTENTPVIPDVLWKMENIRHIYLPYCEMKNTFSLSTLTHLQTLCVGGGEWMMEELPKLSETVKKLHISHIQTAAQIDAALQCPSIKSDRLQKLHLNWHRYRDIFEEYQVAINHRHLEQLANSRHLRKLVLVGRIDVSLACFHFLAGIKKLKLSFSELRSEESIAALGGLPNLSFLGLSDSYLGTKWVCGEGTFPQLKQLTVGGLDNLVEWSIAETAMPRLEKLRLWRCERLPRLPEGVEFITTLKHLELYKMSDEFYNTLFAGVVLNHRHSEQLASCRHLRKLVLGGPIDDSLACFNFPAGIKKLRLLLSALRSEETIAALGSLPNLSVLHLEFYSYLGTKWVCGEGTFPQLKELSIFRLPNLVEWSISETAMPRLEKLSLLWCKSLPRLPEGVEFITTLKHLQLIGMSYEFYETIKGPNAPDAHLIKHIPKVEYMG